MSIRLTLVSANGRDCFVDRGPQRGKRYRKAAGAGGADNERPADWSSDNWATPWPIVRELEKRYGPFDLDPCAEEHTAKAPRFYTKQDDGLNHPWFGRVFVNSPYSDPRPWCERALRAAASDEAELVVMLLPASTATAWFHEVVLPNAHLEFVRRRIRFLGWNGVPIGSPMTGSLIAVLPAGAAAGWAKEKCA